MAGGEVEDYVSVSWSLHVLELLQVCLLLHVINADAEAGRGAFGDEPDLSLPGEKETVACRKVTLLHCDGDVVGRVHEEVVFTELLQ